MANEVTNYILNHQDEMKRGKGKSELIKHAQGEKLTRKQAIHAMCCMCCGYWMDGIWDCQDKECPLYPYSPYNNTGKGSNNGHNP